MLIQNIPYAFLKESSIVTSEDGDLIILSGQTISVPEGSVMQYNSIRIDAGGTLQITGNIGIWTEVGCAGDCVINGQIIARAGYDGQSTHNGGTFTKTSAFGLGNLSYSISQQNGGKGGNGLGVTASAGIGGTQVNGIGGGGAGGGPGGNGGNGGQNGQSSSYAGGTGGGFGNGGNSINDGSNAYPIGGNGASGGGGGLYIPASTSGKFTGTEIAYGGGGAGAYKGHHGKGLVLYVEGSLSGSGSIICSGRAGFVGGAGVDFSGTGGADGGGGGGGGGGAGGSGGSLIVKYRDIISTPSISVSGGSGGAGGAGNNQAGSTGSAGLNGTYILSKI